MADSLQLDFAALIVDPTSAPCPAADGKVESTEEAAMYLNVRGSKVPISQEVISKVPFLDTLFTGRIPNKQDADGNFLLDLDPTLLPAIFKYATTGHCQYLLTALPTSSSSGGNSSSGSSSVHRIHVSDPASIFKTMDYLCVDLQLPSLSVVDDDLKGVAYDEGLDEHSSRLEARDAAVQLMLGISNGTYPVNTPHDRNKLFNMVLFIVSHPSVFYKRLRHWANEIAQRYLAPLTFKQTQLLADWKAKCAATWDRPDSDSDESCTQDSSSYASSG